MSTALIVHAIRNMFARKPKPKPTGPTMRIDGQLGQYTRIAAARYAAKPHMPDVPPFHFWNVSSYSGGGFRVTLHKNAVNGPHMVTGLVAPMSELSPESVIAMAQTIMRATGGNR